MRWLAAVRDDDRSILRGLIGAADVVIEFTAWKGGHVIALKCRYVPTLAWSVEARAFGLTRFVNERVLRRVLAALGEKSSPVSTTNLGGVMIAAFSSSGGRLRFGGEIRAIARTGLQFSTMRRRKAHAV